MRSLREEILGPGIARVLKGTPKKITKIMQKRNIAEDVRAQQVMQHQDNMECFYGRLKEEPEWRAAVEEHKASMRQLRALGQRI